MLYGGTSFGFSVDNNFSHVSDKPAYWEAVIERFYNKYEGIRTWHAKIVDEVVSTGRLVMPTGREYHFDQRDVIRRLWFWRPKILNYPVQGTGADLVAIARVALRKQMRKQGVNALLVSTVHDSIDIDVPVDKNLEPCYNICKLVKTCIEDVPANFEKLFQTKFNLPLTGEVFYGPNLKDLTQYHANRVS